MNVELEITAQPKMLSWKKRDMGPAVHYDRSVLREIDYSLYRCFHSKESFAGLKGGH